MKLETVCSLKVRQSLPLLVVLFCMFCIMCPIALAQSPPGMEKTSTLIEGSNIFMMPRWSPYLVGIGIGMLSWFTFLLSNKPIGVSSSFAKTAGMIEMAFRGREVVVKKPYYQEVEPKIDWGWMLVAGLFCGAFASALLAGDFRFTWIPIKWYSEIGTNVPLRLILSIFGGVCIGFGARWGGGCTSGHGISGTLQLSISSWIAAICFFFGGIAAAMTIYHVFA